MKASHTRVLAIGLDIVEKHLKHKVSDLEALEVDAQASIKGQIDPQVKARALSTARTVLAEVAVVRQKFALQPPEELSEWKRRINGRLIEISNVIYDLRPNPMESYGSLDEEDKEVLSLETTKLTGMVDLMYEIIK